MSLRPGLLITTAQLEARLGDPDLLIFDCTTRLAADEQRDYQVTPGKADFLRGHIPGAQFIDVQNDLSAPNHRYKFMLPEADAFSAAMTRFGLRSTRQVVLYSCADPWWATRVWWLLRVFGFQNARVLDGGGQAWLREQRPLEQGAGRERTDGEFSATRNANLVANADDVLAALGDAQTCILNARLPAQFRGEEGNQYGRAGRIAGSENVPAASLFDDVSGRWLPDDALRARFAPLALADKRVLAYCGHGIAASADVFALTLLGHLNVALYDASLSEWADHDDLPMELG